MTTNATLNGTYRSMQTEDKDSASASTADFRSVVSPHPKHGRSLRGMIPDIFADGEP